MEGIHVGRSEDNAFFARQLVCDKLASFLSNEVAGTNFTFGIFVI